MSGLNNNWKASIAGAVLIVPVMAAAQPVRPIPPVPPAPMIAPMPPIPAIPPMPMIPGALLDFDFELPEIPEMPELPDLPELPEMPDLSFVGPVIAGAMDALAGVGFGPIGPGPVGL